ncbi:ATP-binding protein [uncultured Cohaesibacter sp.]|uniref:ATP-binding protein n=1 Tax=uncultured Cohaesibacter sp. TaxID=1002546 RepID=UPI0029C95D3F|nr:ATP-binding protein [uncultured Cohaesibacter sp.]
MSDATCDISIPNDLASLSLVMRAIPDYAESQQLSEDTRRAAMLVIEELTTNIINYGYGAGVHDEIDINLTKQDDALKITILDGASPFDVEEIEVGIKEDQSLEDMAVGGLGLFLVHQFASSISYQRVGNRNQTRVLLPLGGNGSEGLH